MIIFTTATVFFPVGRLDEEFVDIYLNRYTMSTSEGVLLDGVAVDLSPAESDVNLSTIYPDNHPLTLYRKASIFDGTIAPNPVYDNGDPDTGVVTGHIIWCGWPEQFLNDIQLPPPELAELFDGIRILKPNLPTEPLEEL